MPLNKSALSAETISKIYENSSELITATDVQTLLLDIIDSSLNAIDNPEIDTYVTGGTYSNGTAIFENNYGNTFNVTGFYTGGTDIYTTGLTFNNTTYDLKATRNDGVVLTTNLGVLATDMTITGGTYNANTGVATFTNNTGGTFNVSGFLTGHTDTYVTGMTFNNNVLTLYQTQGNASVSQLINNLSGLTVNGVLSATTYQGLPLDITITGGTYSNGITTFTNNTGGTFTLRGLFTGSTDVYVTGGTYSNGSTTFTNNTGGTFTISGYFTGNTDVHTTGFTYNNNLFSIKDNTGGTLNVLVNTMSGLTVNGSLLSNSISATTYQNLPLDAALKQSEVKFSRKTAGWHQLEIAKSKFD